MKKPELDKELKQKFDAYLYQYETKNKDDLGIVLKLIQYMYYTLTNFDYDLPDQLKFELQTIDILKESEIYNKKLLEYRTAKNQALFFETLENMLDSANKDILHRIPETQLDLYIKTL